MDNLTTHLTSQEIPFGYCHCGCGEKTGPRRDAPNKGQPNKYLRGHGGKRPLGDRFYERFERRSPDECWPWTGHGDPLGYGKISIHGVEFLAHRVSYHLHNGPIPDGMVVCHACDNPSCVNPAHLWLGTKKDNSQDMAQKGRARNVPTPGEAHHNAKLTDEDVITIRRLRKLGIKVAEIAKQYSVTPPLISYIANRKIWTHIPEEV